MNTNFGYRLTQILFLATHCLLLATSLSAQDKGSVTVNGDRIEYYTEEKKIVGEGNVEINYQEMRLTCERIEFFTETKEAIAQGNVRLYQKETVFKGEKLYYNFETQKGEVINLEMEKMGPWYGRGEKGEKVEEKKYIVKEGYITTCDREKPHYRIKSKKIEVFLDEKVVAYDVVFMVGNVPLIYLPYLKYSLKEKYPHFIFIPGRNKKWGWYMLTSWRYDLIEDKKGFLHLDYREKKGFAHGIDQAYSLKDFGSGLFRYYYMQERDKSAPKELRGETERYRVQLKHNWQISDTTRALLEYHKLSDINFIKDYFYRQEYVNENQPRSYLSLVTAQPNYNLSLLVQKRTNHFFTETERLPEVSLNLVNQRLGSSRLYYKADYSLANLTNKQANSDLDDDVRRGDTYQQVSYLTKWGFLNLTPYLGMRQTYYSKDKEGDENLWRGIFYSGLDISTKFYKIYEIFSDFLGLDINRLRHIITPILNYKYIHQPTVGPDELMIFDTIDSLNRENMFTLGIENKLQTKRKEGEILKTVDLGTFLFKGDYNFKTEGIGSEWRNFKFDLELTPYHWLRFESDALYDPPGKDFNTVNFDLTASPQERWSIGLGSRYERNSLQELTASFIYNLSPKWQFRTYERYAFKKILEDGTKRINDFVEQEYVVVRDLHCWTGEFSLNIGDGYAFWVVFRLKAFPEIPFRFSAAYSKPKPY
ncbi:MAG: LPS assembly protein LptD [Candidatus Omnitrophica bacterium]|nr:LPS assembly protein LptD [Candidatus Omnitrophota bacterium]MCM8797874.1 LPS assembly protein LptD [Candidatus Omnitrophota bacterium]